MFVLNPDPYSLPSYRIGPFQTSDIAFNHMLPVDHSIDIYFNERFPLRNYYYTINGRSAINRALAYYTLEKNDVVTILTTTGNFYVSSCVTNEIEKYCKWSRSIEKNTKVIFVIHEFGYPFAELKKLRKYNVPIIEDCASSFFSTDENATIGKIGDFVIYSFPKMFPIQIGGLLVCNQDVKFTNTKLVDDQISHYIKNVLSCYISRKDQIIHKRIQNYNRIKTLFGSLGFEERFKLEDGIVPCVFMFRKNNLNIDLPKLKEYMYAHGIQCSVFYGEESFFIPTHQRLNEIDIEYFGEVVKSFIEIPTT